MPTFLGVATVWGIDGTMLYTGMVATDNLIEAVNFEDTASEHESKSKQGEVIGVKIFNTIKRLTVDFYPSKPAGTGAVAGAKLNVVLPPKGAKVTFADNAAAAVNGDAWLYIQGGTIAETNEGDVKMTLPLRQYSTDIAATATT